LVIDISEDKKIIGNKLKVSLDELIELGVTSHIVIVFNKSDNVSNNEINNRVEYLKNQGFLNNKNFVTISVKNKENIENLFKTIYKSLPKLVRFKIKLPINKETQSLISWIYEKANVVEISYNQCAMLKIDSNSNLKSKIIKKSRELNGSQVFK
jgi:50S ribosomal subunit-associated GTPase HflX